MQLFRVSQRGDIVWVSRRSQLTPYIWGISHRLESLMSTYGLQKSDRIATAIDVGANVGELSLGLCNAGAKVHAFEPDPAEFRSLRMNAGVGFDCHNVALWDENATLQFWLGNETGDSSLIQQKEGSPALTLDAVTLDSWMDAHLPEVHIDVLKVEAEGAEPEVLRGARETLRRTTRVVVDVGHERGFNRESTLEPVTAILTSNGFELMTVLSPRLVAIYQITLDSRTTAE